MKKQIFILLAVIVTASFTSRLYAQDATVNTSRSNIKNNNASLSNTGVCVGKIRCEDGSCIISFEQEIVSPRDAASGLPTGKRMHKPFTITKEYDKSSPMLAKGASSGMGSGKVSMSDLSVMVTIQGRSRKLPVVNNEFTLPADCPNGDCDMVVSWSWGATNSGGSARCEVPFKLSMVDGEYHAINTKGTGATR